MCEPAQDTQATWFSMLEIGFATIALNIPSIWVLIGNVSLESVVRSVRSVFSVSSGSASHTAASNTAAPPTLRRTDKPTASGDDSSTIELVPIDRQAEFYSTATGPAADVKQHRNESSADLEPGIRVERRIEQ